MAIQIKIGTGLAKCQICGEKILKDNYDVVFYDYQIEKHHHFSCIEKELELQKDKDELKTILGE